MRLVSAFLGAASALTADEVAQFGCKLGTYYQFHKVEVDGAVQMSNTASASKDWNGCHAKMNGNCWRTELECSMTVLEATGLGSDRPKLVHRIPNDALPCATCSHSSRLG